MPRITASAEARRRASGALDGNTADSRANAPVLMMPPNTCAASCCPPAKAFSGSRASRCCVAWTDGMVIAVARTSAMVGISAAKIRTRSPPARISSGPGTAPTRNHVAPARTDRMTRESQRRRATVSRMNRPNAYAPAAATGPDGSASRMETTPATQATVRLRRRKRCRAVNRKSMKKKGVWLVRDCYPPSMDSFDRLAKCSFRRPADNRCVRRSTRRRSHCLWARQTGTGARRESQRRAL